MSQKFRTKPYPAFAFPLDSRWYFLSKWVCRIWGHYVIVDEIKNHPDNDFCQCCLGYFSGKAVDRQ